MPTQNKPHNGQTSVRQKFPYHTHPAQHAQLYLIATPLGNLGDISKRAIETLEKCDEIWCEDTRHTQALFTALKLSPKRLRRVDQHTDQKEIEHLLKTVSEKRQQVGIVSDAGTPGVSDPGSKVVECATQYRDIRITPVPGPSAVTTLMSLSGVHENAFSFLGFFPREEKDALELLEKIQKSQMTKAFVFFESPNRIQETIRILCQWIEKISQQSHIEGQIKFVFAKELTKIYETILIGWGSEFLHSILHQHFDSTDKTKGEWCFVIDITELNITEEQGHEDWMVTLECLISAGIPTKDASSMISQRFSVAKNLAYKTALELLKKMKINELSVDLLP